MSKISVVLPVLAPTPFLRAMTEFSIKTLRMHAEDPDYELIVVEAEGNWFDPKRVEYLSTEAVGHSVLARKSMYPDDPEWEEDPALRIDKYLSFVPPIGGVRETNAAIDIATGDYILFTGNDVIAPPNWDRELLRPFEERKDCGASTLGAFEPGAVIGSRQPLDMIVEGMFSPFTMFRRGERLDESYLRIYQDSDLIMRLYERGLRAYRNLRASVYHFGNMTNARVNTEAHNRQLVKDEALFYQRWGRSPLMMFGMIRFGQITYGHEHEAWTREIHRHTYT